MRLFAASSRGAVGPPGAVLAWPVPRATLPRVANATWQRSRCPHCRQHCCALRALWDIAAGEEITVDEDVALGHTDVMDGLKHRHSSGETATLQTADPLALSDAAE